MGLAVPSLVLHSRTLVVVSLVSRAYLRESEVNRARDAVELDHSFSSDVSAVLTEFASQ